MWELIRIARSWVWPYVREAVQELREHGREVFQEASLAVRAADKMDLPGEMKRVHVRERVIREMVEQERYPPGWMINLCIELAVARMRLLGGGVGGGPA